MNEGLEGEVPDLLCKRKEKGKIINFTVQCNDEHNKVLCSCCDHCNGKGHGGLPSDHVHNVDVELDARQKAVFEKLKKSSGNLITIEGTAQNKAANWLIKHDNAQVPAESSFLFQRYVLALLHFMMEDSNPNMLKDKSDLDVCDWDGIGCNGEKHVTTIDFGMF